MFRRLLAATVLCVSVVAQQRIPSKKPSPPAVPVFDIEFRPDPNLSTALTDIAPMMSAQCDTDQNPYVKTAGTDGLEILGFAAKGAITFSTSQMTDVPEPRVQSFSVGSSGIYLLVEGLENARKEEEPLDDANGRESKRVVTKGELRSYIARFDRDGTYRGALKLDSGFRPMQLATFDSGSFVVAGVDENKIPRVGLLNSSGQMVEYLQLQKDVTDHLKSAERSLAASFGAPVSVEVAAVFSQLYAHNGKVLLIRGINTVPIYEIRESGEVRAIKLKLPDGLTVDHLLPSDHNWFFAVRGSRSDMHSETFYEVNPENGQPLRHYRIESKNGLEETLACVFQDEFIGMRHQQGGLTVLRGVAEPAKRKSSVALQ